MLVRTEAFRFVSSDGGTPGNTALTIAATGTNVNDGGSTAWATPENITGDDATRATCNRSSNGTSQLLYATFDLSTVPDGATITGIIVRVQRGYSSGTAPQQVRDHTVRLTTDGTVEGLVGDNKADTALDWPLNSDSNKDYGASDDLWGTALIAAEVKAAAFGVMVKVEHTVSASTNARVDAIWMQVHYTS